jgi:hypothetical protein
MSSSIRIIREELKGIGVIDGDDNMIWKSPDKSYIFKISRSELENLNPLYPRFIISIIIENNIGIKILELRFSELDAVRILDNIEVFCNGEVYYQVQDNFIIPINPNNTSLNSFIIYLENVYDVETVTVGNNTKTIYNDISFKIKQYNPLDGSLIDRVSMLLSYEDINDLAFKLFFECLIDIDFPKDMDPVLERIDDYISNGSNALRMMDYHLDPLPPRNNTNIIEDIDKSSMYESNMIHMNINIPKEYFPVNYSSSGRISFKDHNKEVK